MTCPVCGAALRDDRQIDSSWDSHYERRQELFSCTGCHSIIGRETVARENDRGAPFVHTAASIVVRALQRLQEATERGAIREAVRALVVEPERRALLRVPELRALTAPAFIGPVTLAVAAAFSTRGSQPPPDDPWLELLQVALPRDLESHGKYQLSPQGRHTTWVLFREGVRLGCQRVDGDTATLVAPAFPQHRAELRNVVRLRARLEWLAPE